MIDLFNNLDELKKVVTVQNSFCLEDLCSSVIDASIEYIEKWLGKAQYDKLVTAHANGTATTEENKLIELLQRSLGNFSIYEYLPIGSIHITDAGTSRQENENFKTAYKYQVDDLRRSLMTKGYMHLERMLRFLDANENNYPLWKNHPTAYKCNKQFLINYSDDFGKYVKLKQGRWLFDCLMPVMKSIECFTIEACLGTACFDYLKLKICEGNLSDNDKKLLAAIQPAVAHFTVAAAAKQGWASLSPDGLQFIEQKGNDASKQHNTAKNEMMSVYIRDHEDFGQRHLSKVLDLLKNNPDAYQLWKDKQEEAEEKESDCDCGCEKNNCRCTVTDTGKGGHFIGF